MATMYLLLMLSTKLFTIMTLVITKTVAQEHYSALNATTWLQILSERKTWAILNFPECTNIKLEHQCQLVFLWLQAHALANLRTLATAVQACWWLWKEPGAHIEFESGATMQQTLGRKPQFTQLSQAFIDITDSTANVPYITSVIQSKWGSMSWWQQMAYKLRIVLEHKVNVWYI